MRSVLTRGRSMALPHAAIVVIAVVLSIGTAAWAADESNATPTGTTLDGHAQAPQSAPQTSPRETLPNTASGDTDRAAARKRLEQTLVARGMTRDDARQRVDQLDARDLDTITSAQVQEAGEPPQYIWTLLGVFLVVAIVAALL